MITTAHQLTPGPRRLGRVALAPLAASLLLLAGSLGGAEEAQRSEADRAPAARQSEPDPLSAIGRFIDKSMAGIGSNIKDARDSIDAATGRAGEGASRAAAGLPKTGIVGGHELCPTAPNGAPDCRVATAQLCRAKGFESGSSLDFQSERKCPAYDWQSGRRPTQEECWTESYVTRALCR